MVRLNLYNEELWPVYHLQIAEENESSEFIMEIPDELHKEYLEKLSQFRDMQNKLREYFIKAQERENARYCELMDLPRRSRLDTVTYCNEDAQQCSLCGKEQKEGLYQGKQYMGCNNCFDIKPVSKHIIPNLLEQSITIKKLINNG